MVTLGLVSLPLGTVRGDAGLVARPPLHGEVLEKLIRDRGIDGAAAMIIQWLKATHQVALDKGSWKNVVMLLPTADPLVPPEFGRTAAELSSIHRYQKALAELKARHGALLQGESQGVADGGGEASDPAPEELSARARKQIACKEKRKAECCRAWNFSYTPGSQSSEERRQRRPVEMGQKGCRRRQK